MGVILPVLLLVAIVRVVVVVVMGGGVRLQEVVCGNGMGMDCERRAWIR